MPSAQRLAVIFNPWANRGRAAALLDSIRWRLRAMNVIPDIFPTPAPGAGTALARQIVAAGEHRAVIAAGGDGTINEVVNGLFGSAMPLAFLPLGTGNDFVKMLPQPKELELALEHIVRAEVRAIDVGTVNGRAFINGVGIGIDAQIAIEAQRIKRLKGLAVYLAALARTIYRFTPPQLDITIDGQTRSGRWAMVTIGNGACHGGGFWITPDAKIDDGVFDVCAVAAMSTPRMLRHFPKVMQGRHTSLAEVRISHAQSVQVVAPGGAPVHFDGEILGAAVQQLDIRLHPAALKVLL